jgi:putative solute:sodium symporter small subunit
VNRRLLYVLLVLPFVATLVPPFYARPLPALFGFPFFYWYQVVWVILAALLVWTVYAGTKRRTP